MSLFNNSPPSIGFTGTGHKPLTPAQRCILTVKLMCYWKEGYRTFRHGDCIHADEEADTIAFKIGFIPIIHPPG